MKKKIIILAAFVVTFFTACTSTHMITFSNAELSDKEKDMIENNSNYSTASIVGGSAKLVKEERDKAIQEKIEARRNKLKAIDGLSISSYKDKNGKEQFKATAQSEILLAAGGAKPPLSDHIQVRASRNLTGGSMSLLLLCGLLLL